LVGEHGAVDDIGESSFEDSEGFHGAVTGELAWLHEFTGGSVQPCLSHRDAVQGSVELPIPGARQSVSLFV